MSEVIDHGDKTSSQVAGTGEEYKKAERTKPRAIKHPFQTDPSKPPELQAPVPFEQGLVSVYYGNGKGKTSSAIGVAVRAAGHGLRVLFLQFMKGDERYGEQFFFEEYDPDEPGNNRGEAGRILVRKFGPAWFLDMNNVTEDEKQPSRVGITYAREAMLSGEFDVIIMDEINVVVGWKVLPVEDVVQLLQARPAAVELVLTGRYAPKELKDLADYVTEFKEEKHPYQKGILAREGIDY